MLYRKQNKNQTFDVNAQSPLSSNISISALLFSQVAARIPLVTELGCAAAAGLKSLFCCTRC